MQDKRECSCLVPYRMQNGIIEFFLQMRDAHARANPNKYGFFGGGMEDGESEEQCLMREIAEELEYVPTRHVYYTRFETDTRIFHMYLEEVDADFASRVHVNEGQYGKFLAIEDIQTLPEVGDVTRFMSGRIHTYLAQKVV